MSAFIEMAPLFIFPTAASLIGLVRSWRGVLNRDTYLAWGLGLTVGIPLLATLVLFVGFPLEPGQPVSDEPDGGMAWMFSLWINGLLGAVAVVLVALVDKVSSEQ